MFTNAIKLFEPSGTVEKRAQWETFTLAVDEDGSVTVTTASYGADAAEHTYTVRVNTDTGIPVSCTCWHHTYQDVTCKHMTAVAVNAYVLAVAVSGVTESEVSTDGGYAELRDADEDAETCPHGHTWCDGPTDDDLPCWPCFRDADRDDV